jgi:hypothetical protein
MVRMELMGLAAFVNFFLAFVPHNGICICDMAYLKYKNMPTNIYT